MQSEVNCNLAAIFVTLNIDYVNDFATNSAKILTTTFEPQPAELRCKRLPKLGEKL